MNQIAINRANHTHSKLIWEWRNDQETRSMSRQGNFISWRKHCEWFKDCLSSSTRYLYILELNSKPIGITRFDLLTSTNNSYEISINLASCFRGKGLGKSLLHYSLIRFNKEVSYDKLILAEVKRENLKSNLLFSRYGFVLIHQDKTINRYSYTLYIKT